MTISTEVRTAGPYTGNGSTTEFAFAFKVFEASDVVVKTTTNGTTTTETLTTDYSVTLNADQDVSAGGTITMVTPLLASTTLTISSDVPTTQNVKLANLGGFYPTVFNDALDRATIQIQQVDQRVSDINSTLVTPQFDTTADYTLTGVWTHNANVGINTANGDQPLTVIGGTRIGTADDSAASQLSLGGASGSTGNHIITDASGNLSFNYGNAAVGSSSLALRIDTSGNLLVKASNIISGVSAPEGSVTAPIGSLFLRSDGGTATSLYVKESGTGNTGWIGVGAGASTTNLNSLSDVSAGSPSDGQVLSWSDSSSAWVAASLGSGGGGATSLNELSDVTITSAAANQVLNYDTGSSKFVNTATPTVQTLNVVKSGAGFTQGLLLTNYSGDGVSIDAERSIAFNADYNDNSGGSQSAIVFKTNNTEHVRITSGGFVGIKNNDPKQELEVRGQALITGTSSASTDIQTIINTGTPLLTAVHTVPSGITWTSSGDTELMVMRDSNCKAAIVTDSASDCELNFGDESDLDVGGLIYRHVNDSLIFKVNGAQPARLLANGNMGIGVSAPAEKLEVAGTIKATAIAAPAVTQASGAQTLAASDMNNSIVSTGNVTVNGSVGSAGDVVIVYNNTAGNISIIDGTITTMRLDGTTTTGTRTVAPRGMAFIFFISSSEVVVGGKSVT